MIYRFDEFSIDSGLYQLSRQDKVLPIEPLAFDLLVYLIQNRARVVGRDELLDNLWPGKVVTDSALAARMKDARRALGDSGELQHFIKTVHGRGYQFVADIDEQGPFESANVFDQIHSGQPLALPAKPSIAVLPLACEDRDDEFFSEGIADSIRNSLTRFRELFVMGRNSAFCFRNERIDDAQIGRKLGVRHLVQGTLRRHAEHLRVNVELVDALSGQNLWSESFDCQLREFFALENEIVRAIAATLVLEVEDVAYREAQSRAPENVQAWEWVLRGNRAFENGSAQDLEQACQMYERAIELDPANSAAYTGLSNVTLNQQWGRPSDEYRDMVRRSLEYGQKAVALDAQDSRAHYAVGHGYLCLGQHDIAELHVDKALALNPSEYHNLCFKGYMLACTGQYEESEAMFSASIRRNPLSPKSCFCGVGLSRYLASRYDDATAMLARLAGDSYVQHKYSGLAAAHAQLGNDGQSSKATREFLAQIDPALLSKLGDDSAQWRSYLSNLYSILKPEDLRHLFGGLRKAGLPI